MLNMLNPFYSYIVEHLHNYFLKQQIKAGNRYYLQLEQQEEVDAFVTTLSKLNGIQKFSYCHEYGEPYETIALPINNVLLVIANTSAKVKPDFLVTLRNQVSEQKGVWNGTALLSVVSTQLDSIQGGSSDLQKEGMPLHPSTMYNILKQEIDSSSLSKVEKMILLDCMDKIIQDQYYQQITFFEFEDIVIILKKGKIEENDYKKFGMFRDSELETYTGSKLKDRLEINRELFDFIRKCHEYGLDDEELEKKFSPSGIGKIKSDNWQSLNFTEVWRYHQEALELNKKEKVELKEITVTNNLEFWNRPQNESTAGQRKRHIIIFDTNKQRQEGITLTANFSFEGSTNRSLSDQFVKLDRKHKSTTTVVTGRTNLKIHIIPDPNNVTFTRVAYRHNNKSSLGAEFFIAVVPVDPHMLSCFKTNYLIDPKQEVIKSQYDGRKIIIGLGEEIKEIQLDNQNNTVNLSLNQKLKINPLPEAFNDEDQLKLFLKLNDSGTIIPFLLVNEVPESVPITPFRIWKLKRETKKDFILANNRLIHENREFYVTNEFKQFYEWEYQWLESSFKCAELVSGQLVGIDVEISDDLKEAYSRFLNYFTINHSVPSLCYLSTEYKERAEEYVNAYINEIRSFQEGQPAGKKGRNLFKLGTLHTQNGLYLTPFHPLMVAYQIQLNKELLSEDVDNNILSRLKPDALVPYLYDENDELLRPFPQNGAVEWQEYRPVKLVSVSDADKYLAKLIEDKMRQFQEHFNYLFHRNSKSPLKINVIGIENDFEVVRGIIKWMISQIKHNELDSVKAIEVSLYRNQAESSFDLLSGLVTVEEFQQKFDIDLTKGHEFDAADVLRMLHNKLLYYKRTITEQFEYAHISFYKMHAQEQNAVVPMDSMITGMALNGVYSFVPSMKTTENYRNGFGTKSFPLKNNNILTQTAIHFNEFCANLRNGGNDAYKKNATIVSITSPADEQLLNRIYQASHWVTFVDSNIDLDFFSDHSGNLIVIHYSDQYSSSNKYDAITVTDKTHQYYAVIREFLHSKNVDAREENIHHAIKAFNTFNGEWLLRIIGDKGNYSREKLSIISAIKFSLAYFDHPDIMWVPISLEEILRVAGVVNLSKLDGIFTAKNLGVKGAHSDDLLLIGLERNVTRLKMHFYPIEVKIGQFTKNVSDKAKVQVKKTKQMIMQALVENDTSKPFTAKFYRYFFVQLFVTNANKLFNSGFWPEKNYLLDDVIIEKLLDDDFEISMELEPFIGIGAVISFQQDVFYRSERMEDGIVNLILTKHDGFNGIIKPMGEMHEWIQVKENDFVKENMLSYLFKRSDGSPNTKQETYQTTNAYSNIRLHGIIESLNTLEEKVTPEKTHIMTETVSVSSKTELPSKEKTKQDFQQIRILLGKAENSNRNVYWEFGNPELPNRHLLISGKSGQGKTYFMQCLLLELSKMGISSIVIDYTEGFLPNHLEPEFKAFLGPKLIQKIIYTEQFPINPFKKNTRDIGGITLPESNTDVAERIKSVFASVYRSLGIQQLNAIYEATLIGLDRYGDGMTLENLRSVLEQDHSNYAKTALSQIRPLIDRDPFIKESEMQWNEILNGDGNVFVIQLTGYPRDVQLIITEFILWDLWNYSLRYGNKHNPIPILLDEAQNLDHSEKSPSAKILTEGRKFGWSGWYATQFLKSQLQPDELARLQNASQKIYFAQPEQEISYVANSLAIDSTDKKHFETKLSSLKKGQCIVHGPIALESGNLSSPLATVVEITPLSERVK